MVEKLEDIPKIAFTPDNGQKGLSRREILIDCIKKAHGVDGKEAEIKYQGYYLFPHSTVKKKP